MKKNQNILSENFHFLVVKFSVYLNRCVFVMLLKPSILFFIFSKGEQKKKKKKKKKKIDK